MKNEINTEIETWASIHLAEFHARDNKAPNMNSPPESLLVRCVCLWFPSSLSVSLFQCVFLELEEEEIRYFAPLSTERYNIYIDDIDNE